ncbi:DUF4390 domain-containing protein [Chitinibacter sp. S2-10]|uniref:DUF4390 domain-containing protein n=1 Tax=Chitinibacter sp. S2-10 TaxID=3373597 RepID=UPI0039774C98
MPRLNWRLLGSILALLFSVQTQAASIKNTKAEADIIPPRIEVSARYSITLSPELEDALRNGLTLPFIYEFKLTKPRFYAWYRQLAEGFGANAELTQRLSYQPLTKQFRISAGGITRHFASLDEALIALGHIKNWSVMDGSDLTEDEFAGKLRLRLDSAQLPKTYQVSTLGNANWQLESGWVEIQLHRNTETEVGQ